MWNLTDLRSSLQYMNFDILHSFWGLMVANNRHLLVLVTSVIFQLAQWSAVRLAFYKLRSNIVPMQ